MQASFHVTLIHRASAKEHSDIWALYTDLYKAALQGKQKPPGNNHGDYNASATPSLGSARVRIERLIWDDRIMTFVTRILPQEPSSDPTMLGNADTWPCANDIPHVTIGTAGADVKPKESNDLLRRWLEVGAGDGTGIWETEVPNIKVLEGTVVAVMNRR